MSSEVFISAGTPANPVQKKYLEAVIGAIRATGLRPRRMDDSDFDYKNPLRSVSRVMENCHGAVVVAYERYKIISAFELRMESEEEIAPASFPTVWNQIEAAMAYERDLPILVVAQKCLKEDAFFEPTNDIQPIWSDLDVVEVTSSRFRAAVDSWARDVRQFAERSPAGTMGDGQRRTETSLNDRLPVSATVKQLLAGAVSLVFILAATIGLLIFAANKVPTHFTGIIVAVVPLMILGLAFVARASGLIGAGQMISLFRIARRKSQGSPDDPPA